MATRTSGRNSSGGLRRPSISLGFTPGGRQTLLQSLNTQAADEKAKRNEEINKALEDIKNQGQDVLDGNMTIADFEKAVDAAKVSVSEKSGTIATYANSVIKTLDNNKFNEYANGGTLKDFKEYVDSRKSAGGNLDALNALWGKAQTNEDTLKFNSYSKGDLSYNDFVKYATDRVNSGGSADKIGAYVAQATTHENQLKDNDRSSAYSAGLLSGADYLDYLHQRASTEVNAQVSGQLKVAAKTVEDNEFSTKVNQVVAEYESNGNASTAIQKLNALMGQTTNAKLQQGILAQVGAIKKASAASAAGAASGAATSQAEATRIYSEGLARYDQEDAKLKAELAKATPSTVSSVISRMEYNDKTFMGQVSIASQMSPQAGWQASLGLVSQQVALDMANRRIVAYQTVAENLAAENKAVAGAGGVSPGDPYKGNMDAANFLYAAAKDVQLGDQGVSKIGTMANGYVAAARRDFNTSDKGPMWNNRVSEVLDDLKANPMALQILLKEGAPNIGKLLTSTAAGPQTLYPPNDPRWRDWVENTLAGNGRDIIRAALTEAGAQGYADHPFDEKVIDPDTGKPYQKGQYTKSDVTITKPNAGITAKDFGAGLDLAGAGDIRGVLATEAVGQQHVMDPYQRALDIRGSGDDLAPGGPNAADQAASEAFTGTQHAAEGARFSADLLKNEPQPQQGAPGHYQEFMPEGQIQYDFPPTPQNGPVGPQGPQYPADDQGAMPDQIAMGAPQEPQTLDDAVGLLRPGPGAPAQVVMPLGLMAPPMGIVSPTGITPPSAVGPRPAFDDILDPGYVDPFAQYQDQQPSDPNATPGIGGAGGGRLE